MCHEQSLILGHNQAIQVVFDYLLLPLSSLRSPSISRSKVPQEALPRKAKTREDKYLSFRNERIFLNRYEVFIGDTLGDTLGGGELSGLGTFGPALGAPWGAAIDASSGEMKNLNKAENISTVWFGRVGSSAFIRSS